MRLLVDCGPLVRSSFLDGHCCCVALLLWLTRKDCCLLGLMCICVCQFKSERIGGGRDPDPEILIHLFIVLLLVCSLLLMKMKQERYKPNALLMIAMILIFWMITCNAMKKWRQKCISAVVEAFAGGKAFSFTFRIEFNPKYDINLRSLPKRDHITVINHNGSQTRITLEWNSYLEATEGRRRSRNS